MGYSEMQNRINSGEFKNKKPYPTFGKVKGKKQETVDIQYKEHREEEYKIIQVFRKALEEEYEMLDHPKRDLVWLKAWDNGHSEGYGEINNVYRELVELVSEPRVG